MSEQKPEDIGQKGLNKVRKKLYDHIPFNLKQMDLIIRILVVLIVIAFIVGVMLGS